MPDPSGERRPLRACYRLQLHQGFGFRDALAQLDHLDRLGVSHLYLSPILGAVPGSMHGYDVVDHHRISDELGGDGGLRELVEAAHERGIGLVVDIVPNHMAVHPTNRQWWDVLRFGRASAYADWFDILWEHGSDEIDDRLLLPVLADHYGTAVAEGAISLDVLQGVPVVRSGELVLPMSVAATVEVLREVAARLGSTAYAEAVEQLAGRDTSATDQESKVRDLTVLASWPADGDRDPAATLRDVVSDLSAERERLHELLELQHYRLAYWQTGADALDYRRFFDVTDLIGLRVEDPAVFERTHSRILSLVADGTVDGLRVDHIDGLVDPAGYASQLRASAGDAWIVVEKILEPGEVLPAQWPVDGTTGYETACLIDSLFVDQANERELTELLHDLTGEVEDYETVRRTAKQLVATEVLATELHRLAADLVEHATSQVDRVDVAAGPAEAVIRSFLVEMPVYRTYARGTDRADDRDVEIVDRVRRVLNDRGEHDAVVVDLIADTLIGPTASEAARRFRARFQQTSGPVMAKGVEDTTFYRWARLVSLNEVGGDPARFGIGVDDFHDLQVRAAKAEPARMVTSTTHDTKRSEDVRARIAVLSEVPELWRDVATRWAQRSAALWPDPSVERDPAVELLLHQTFFGAAPISAERAHQYATKAMREAKRRTSWTAPDEAYEAALHETIDRWFADPEYLRDQQRLLDATVVAGRMNGLAAKLLTLTVPGVPDVYQGTELWTDSLVDPDNRRAVDYALRAELSGRPAPTRLDPLDDGASKLAVVAAALGVRRRAPHAFAPGSGTYEPLVATGDAAGHVVAFARGGEVVTVVPRLVVGLARAGGWRDTSLRLPDGAWLDVLSGAAHAGGAVQVGDLFAVNQLALLVRT